jgi:hypothetical protein
MKHTFLLVGLISLLGCGRIEPETKDLPPSYNLSEENTAEIMGPTSYETALSTERIIEVIDSVYAIEKSDFFKLAPLNIQEEPRVFAFALNQNGLAEASRYGVFTLLKYKSPTYAKESFEELAALLETFKVDESIASQALTTKDGATLYYDVMAKSGSIFMLKGPYILHKLRRCNDNYRLNESKENQLLHKLNGGSFPAHHFFIRDCCSCPRKEQLIIK